MPLAAFFKFVRQSHDARGIERPYPGEQLWESQPTRPHSLGYEYLELILLLNPENGLSLV